MTSSDSPSGETAVAGGTVAASGVAIAACAACCALPLVVPALALGVSGAVLAWLAGAQGWLSILAAVLVAGGWVWTVRTQVLQRRRGRPPVKTSTWLLLGVATVLAITAFAWPAIEPSLLALLS